MHQYLLDMEYAVRGLIGLITIEENVLSALRNKCEGLSRKENDLNQKLINASFNELDSLQEQAAAIALHKTSEELVNLKKQTVVLQFSIDAKSVSINALSGAILQIAKQGISITHGHLSQCPDGRNIGKEKLKNVIWESRNQSIHYEEGNFRQPVIDCFANLEMLCGNKFSLSLNVGRNLAHDIIEELGWKDYSTYESDLRSLTWDR